LERSKTIDDLDYFLLRVKLFSFLLITPFARGPFLTDPKRKLSLSNPDDSLPSNDPLGRGEGELHVVKPLPPMKI
jgi:hypothetical protein